MSLSRYAESSVNDGWVLKLVYVFSEVTICLFLSIEPWLFTSKFVENRTEVFFRIYFHVSESIVFNGSFAVVKLFVFV